MFKHRINVCVLPTLEALAIGVEHLLKSCRDTVSICRSRCPIYAGRPARLGAGLCRFPETKGLSIVKAPSLSILTNSVVSPLSRSHRPARRGAGQEGSQTSNVSSAAA
jgi:hypothetical protein